ncbi:Ger(x)C family spore germination protein [Thermohalobacter berrensis]|uniref:Uncharacterized protein n=1 Tax=Thermohalobacter berrensis TaxID=99594 RepID=A0A419T1N6_9FIRM|nr:Ger(x)C family spore germination protein [Thermohalobacter berrensis]RKD31387.1 hypothetical protein BET03_12710 [Thermohalobacter berrensis]
MKRKNSKNKLLIIISLFMITSILPGCWDRVEIEELGIVVGMAIDLTEPEKSALRKNLETREKERPKHHRITLTQQFIIPRALIQGGGQNQGGGGQKPYSNIESEGDTILAVARQYASQSSRVTHYRHLKVIVLSEEVARLFNIKNLLNVFLRDPEIERDVKIMISEGKAFKALDVAPKKEQIPAFKLNQLVDNMRRSARIAPEVTIADMSKRLVAKSSFIVQRVIPHKDEVKLAGAAVISGKTRKMIGWLGEEEVDGINWLTGQTRGGVVEAVDEKTDEYIVYDIQSVTSKIIPEVKDGKISFTIEINSEGAIGEDWLIPGNAFKNEFLIRAKQAIKREVRNIVDDALNKTQKQFKVDVIGCGKQLSIKYPQVWQQVKDNWDEYFSKIPVNVQIKINIRTFGRRGTKR